MFILLACNFFESKYFIEKLNYKQLPEIALMTINMPVMDGYETTLYLKQHYPDIKVLALSMYDSQPKFKSVL